MSTRIEFPDLKTGDCSKVACTPPPLTIGQGGEHEYWDLTLAEAMHLALVNSKVLRDLGGTVLDAPDHVQTIHSPSIQETDPRFGVAGALSAFDASWSTQAFFEKNDRALNNQFFGGGTRILKQDLLAYHSEIFKRNAIGGDFAVRHNVDYDFNNAPGNNIPNLPWATNVEVEMRQPILQGAGVDFNRIAGPDGTPGLYNGVLIARVNTDVSLADFEMGVRDLINDAETAYWALYFAYRDLDAKMRARDQALETWRYVRSLFESRRRGGDAAKEAQAREQYFRLEQEVQNALSGKLEDRALSRSFRLFGGIHIKERQLRLMLGLPINDGRLIRPASEPTVAKVVFCWDDILNEALLRRAELRRQKWKIKRRELELTASRNFLLPQLDTVGRYRWRGLGHDLIEPNGAGRPAFNDAFQNMFDGGFQEWQVGVEFAFPIGFRQAHAAVRNAQLNLARDHAILDEQEREISHDVSNAYAELERAYLAAQTSLNRRSAAKDQVDALTARYQRAEESELARLLDLLLDAQRRLADAESQYYRAITEYSLAIKQVHYAKGSLLDYNEIYLSEGRWPKKAYADARQRDRLRAKHFRLDNFIFSRSASKISRGDYPQRIELPVHVELAPSTFERLPPVESPPPNDG